MKAADFGLFGASWWPYASFEALKISTLLVIWVRSLLLEIKPGTLTEAVQLFIWDDGTPNLTSIDMFLAHSPQRPTRQNSLLYSQIIKQREFSEKIRLPTSKHA